VQHCRRQPCAGNQRPLKKEPPEGKMQKARRQNAGDHAEIFGLTFFVLTFSFRVLAFSATC
jgi:hypothetical protein